MFEFLEMTSSGRLLCLLLLGVLLLLITLLRVLLLHGLLHVHLHGNGCSCHVDNGNHATGRLTELVQ